VNVLARTVVGLIGAFSLVMGLTTLLDPDQVATSLGFGPLDAMGLNSLRADVGGFFLAAAVFCGIGLFRGRSGWILGGALLYGLAAVGRITGVAMAGAPEGVVTPIVVEIILVALLLGSVRILRAGNRHTQANP
jgi:hypothetical protein